MPLNTAQKTNLSVTWILGGIATTTVVARMYVRFVLQRNPGWDDYAMLICWCLAAASASLATIAIHYGLGVDLADIQDPYHRVQALKYLTLAPPSSILSVAVGKISIVLLFHRLLGVSMTKFRSVVLWTLICITICLSVAAVVAVVAFCVPTQSIWDKTLPARWCMTQHTQLGIGLAQASFNAFTDFIFGLLPAYTFWNLQMPLRRKIGLMMLFGAGVFGCVITSIKAYQLRNLTGHDNLTRSWSPITIWNTAEMFVLITCAKIPTTRSLFRRVFNLSSSFQASYPLQAAPKDAGRSSQGGSRTGFRTSTRKTNTYVSIDNSQNQSTSSQKRRSAFVPASVAASTFRVSRRTSFDKMYPLTRRDSPADGAGDSESESQRGIVRRTDCG